MTGSINRTCAVASCLVATVIASIGTPLAGQTIRRGQVPLEEIRIEGNVAVSTDSLLVAIENRPTECRSGLLAFFCWLGADFATDTRFLLTRRIGDDMQRVAEYYARRGYREATVDTTLTIVPDSSASTLTFRVDEGRPVLVGSIDLVGDPLPDSALLDGFPLRIGDPFSAILLEAAEDTLTSRLQNSGYANSLVFVNSNLPTDSYDASVEFDVFTGPLAHFGPITVAWNGPDSALSTTSVLRFLPFQEGDLYRRDQVFEAQRTLFGVDLIRSARIVERRTEESGTLLLDSIIPLRVEITEGDVHRVRAGAGWSTSECLNAEVNWSSRNFLGDTRRLTLRSRISNVFARDLNDTACIQAGEDEFAEINGLLSAELFQPWLFSTRNSLSTSVFAERASLPDVFVRRAVGVNVSVTRSLAAGTPLTLSYSPQLSSLAAAEIFFCTSFLVCAPDDISALQSSNWLAPVGLSVSRDQTDNLLDPSSGYSLLLDLEHASEVTGSDFAYDRVIAEAATYSSFARRTVLGFRLRGGWIRGGEFEGLGTGVTRDIVHPQKRFFSGGASSVRGFAQNRLGPRVLTTSVGTLLSFRDDGSGTQVQTCTPQSLVDLTCDPDSLPDGAFTPRPTGGTRLVEANAEYRFRWGREFQGVLFLDVGQVWAEDEDFAFEDFEWTPGVGIRYFSPIGPLRVDLGFRFRGGEDLQVITSQIAPFENGSGLDPICIAAPAGFGTPGSQGCPRDLVPIPWVSLESLAVLERRDFFGDSGGFFRNLQLHFSIGQAF